MLTILGKRDQTTPFCDGLLRRSFLQIGGLGLSGLALPQLLRAEAVEGKRSSHKAVIMIFMTGGPAHQDLFDLKTEAPAEIRGPFQPIASGVPGIQVCEHLPRIAAVMDKLAIIRSLVGGKAGHLAYQCVTGWAPAQLPAGKWPSLPAVVSKLQGSASASCPPGVNLWYRWGGEPNPGPGFLGMAHAPFEPMGDFPDGDRPNRNFDSMVLKGITLDQLQDRRALLRSFDQLDRELDAGSTMQGIDAFRDQAFGMLTTGKVAAALDLSKENPKVVQRYGWGDPRPRLASVPQHFLLARRLVEAGARVVMLNHATWDWHEKNFENLKKQLPVFDRALTALVEDLHERGLADDVTVIAWGEMGRTPKINNMAGRDHWDHLGCALLAGGGMRTGQAIGATDRTGGYAKDRPVSRQEVFATLYHNLGIDVNQATVPDLQGRPQYLVESGVQPIRELVS